MKLTWLQRWAWYRRVQQWIGLGMLGLWIMVAKISHDRQWNEGLLTERGSWTLDSLFSGNNILEIMGGMLWGVVLMKIIQKTLKAGEELQWNWQWGRQVNFKNSPASHEQDSDRSSGEWRWWVKCHRKMQNEMGCWILRIKLNADPLYEIPVLSDTQKDEKFNRDMEEIKKVLGQGVWVSGQEKVFKFNDIKKHAQQWNRKDRIRWTWRFMIIKLKPSFLQGLKALQWIVGYALLMTMFISTITLCAGDVVVINLNKGQQISNQSPSQTKNVNGSQEQGKKQSKKSRETEVMNVKDDSISSDPKLKESEWMSKDLSKKDKNFDASLMKSWITTLECLPRHWKGFGSDSNHEKQNLKSKCLMWNQWHEQKALQMYWGEDGWMVLMQKVLIVTNGWAPWNELEVLSAFNESKMQSWKLEEIQEMKNKSVKVWVDEMQQKRNQDAVAQLEWAGLWSLAGFMLIFMGMGIKLVMEMGELRWTWKKKIKGWIAHGRTLEEYDQWKEAQELMKSLREGWIKGAIENHEGTPKETQKKVKRL